MKRLEINGGWNIIRSVFKRKWAKLINDDLHYVEGQQEGLPGRTQKHTGEIRKSLEKSIREASANRAA
jgi:uncharacterized protein YjbJ (UPF0337 family)